MDFLQIALIFLIALLSIFLAITGIQVFLILRDLKKALDKLNKIIESGENIAQDIQKPVSVASNLVSSLANGAKALTSPNKKPKQPNQSSQHPRRFYKRSL